MWTSTVGPQGKSGSIGKGRFKIMLLHSNQLIAE